ncbi:MAG: hypothetical protein ACXW20_13875 [Burkholderiales bacterium]
MSVVRRFRTGWLTGGAHLLILWIAIEAEAKEAWPFALGAMAVVSFFAWMANFRRYRQVHDLPTSKVSSAAQGYVELYGRCAPIPDSPITAPCSSLPCCWFSYWIEAKDGDGKWRQEDSGESIGHFLLVDNTGQCVISPDGAEVLYPRKSVWTEGDRRYTEWLLLPQAPLYAIGEFMTSGGADLELDENKDVSDMLAEWKKDRTQLLERFDRDKSGEVDLKEWEDARMEARREVQKNHAELKSHPGVHIMRKPADGRVFILAAGLPEKIGRRFAFWSWFHLIFMFGSGMASLLLLST